jgi:hypothetical protein
VHSRWRGHDVTDHAESVLFNGFMAQALFSVGMFLVGSFFAISGLTLNSLTLMMKANH